MRWLVLCAIACVLVVGGCSSNRSASEPGTVNFLLESMPPSFDPRIATDAVSQHVYGLIFNSLLATDAQMNIVPDLAESWEQPDPVTYVFHLRHGVKFQDGRAFTSADVKFTFDSILDGRVKTPKRGSFRLVKSVEAPDEFTIDLSFAGTVRVVSVESHSSGHRIVPAGLGAGNCAHPVGTGPFRFVLSTMDQEIVLERNPTYFGATNETPVQQGNVQRVRFRIVPDAIVRALELRKGSADVALDSLSPDTVVALAKESGITVDEQPGNDDCLHRFQSRGSSSLAPRRPPGACLRHRSRDADQIF